jgi:exopolyphosphatase/guanosine-5'-triphosphate,3'-diphosphate pyrophosphatase
MRLAGNRILRLPDGAKLTLAAVDLGSNSFHLQIGRAVDGQIYPLDSLRKFGERLRGFPRQAVRAVGTNTLRGRARRRRLAAGVRAAARLAHPAQPH